MYHLAPARKNQQITPMRAHSGPPGIPRYKGRDHLIPFGLIRPRSVHSGRHRPFSITINHSHQSLLRLHFLDLRARLSEQFPDLPLFVCFCGFRLPAFVTSWELLDVCGLGMLPASKVVCYPSPHRRPPARWTLYYSLKTHTNLRSL